MKRTDDVFFFTLIDFLIQSLFFGLLLYVLGQARQQQETVSQKADAASTSDITKFANAAGFSNLTQLADYLSKLAPVSDFKGMADFFSAAGGIKEVKAAVGLVQAAGGTKTVTTDLNKLRKFEEGTGKPPCLFDIVGGKKVVKSLATVTATESMIQFEATNPELEIALALLGRSFNSVQSLPLAEFSKTFAPLVQRKSECRYTLRFLETTRFVDARDAARLAFYLNIRKI
jgi:hypothetical protein